MQYFVGIGDNPKYPGIISGPFDYKPDADTNTLWIKKLGGEYPNHFIYYEQVEWNTTRPK